MKNTLKTQIPEAVFNGKVVFDKNPDKPMFYFQFEHKDYKVFIGIDSIFSYLYEGIEKKFLPESLFSWLVENNSIMG